MPNKECPACKLGDDTYHPSAVKTTGCEESYLRVDACMKLNRGRVSACVEEWRDFRKCHELVKEASKDGEL
ncbi:hypothetical protein CCR75_007685 [Bremia lactucae]|uniref:Uncharacterized protein n=1 Tax=Bremia lactucae TaxID=4779 RepID=A0A976IG17_BRELC|nr:hypothetical protein CCR75_007683 [Bremia lactucae]TDH70443.1 hypothetical protein CCR75_007685 [Bremia lactucae]